MNVQTRMSRALALSAALFGSQIFADEKPPVLLKIKPATGDVTVDNSGLPLQTFGSVTLPGEHLGSNAPALGAAQLIGQIEAFHLAVETPAEAPAELTVEVKTFGPHYNNGAVPDRIDLPYRRYGVVSLPPVSRSTTEPALGEPQLIGHLETLADFKIQSINLEEPYLGPPILLASLEEDIEETATAIPASDPEQIQHHLQQSIRLLADAGLTEQAQGVRSVLDEFRSNHRDRLALNKKRAELAALQAEIAQLEQVSHAVASQQMLIDLKICEIDKDALGNTPQTLTVEDFKKLHEGWAAKKAITPLSNPQIRAFNGQQAEIYVGSQLAPVPELNNVRPGVSVALVPTILDDHRVRASITSERTELAGSAQQPLVSRSKVQTESELSLDRVVWFSLGETATDSNKVAIVWATLTNIAPPQTAYDANRRGSGVTPASFSAPR